MRFPAGPGDRGPGDRGPGDRANIPVFGFQQFLLQRAGLPVPETALEAGRLFWGFQQFRILLRELVEMKVEERSRSEGIPLRDLPVERGISSVADGAGASPRTPVPRVKAS